MLFAFFPYSYLSFINALSNPLLHSFQRWCGTESINFLIKLLLVRLFDLGFDLFGQTSLKLAFDLLYSPINQRKVFTLERIHAFVFKLLQHVICCNMQISLYLIQKTV